MRKLAIMLAAAMCMSTAAPAFADMAGTAQKDECLLASKNCSNTVDDIQNQVRRLTAEIQKGTKVYSPDELAKLQMKLNDIKAMIERMNEE
ncbi:hypothetical protein [Geomesophilobacter sediminis]|uniref:Uncharacterized protein n=1 Tax=Geomesophilobacter sediminis TaxID=2798584 RepID=A0A8J7M1L7_9BACT|nr:hypothetical protein [Geomesophilobacter sediminis]MBJ6727006.1 hypothetical protein [Geomesophilobacter sediminis]